MPLGFPEDTSKHQICFDLKEDDVCTHTRMVRSGEEYRCSRVANALTLHPHVQYQAGLSFLRHPPTCQLAISESLPI